MTRSSLAAQLHQAEVARHEAYRDLADQEDTMEPTYTMTRRALADNLESAIQMYIEYRDVHGYGEGEAARLAAVGEVLEGIDALAEFKAEAALLAEAAAERVAPADEDDLPL